MKDDPGKKTVYCSGPLFCPEEIGGMTAIARVLEARGFGTFLPHRDGIEAYVMRLVDLPSSLNVKTLRAPIDRAIFALDVFQIVERCDCLVFNMNGRVPDEGGVVEAAIAFAAGKPLVIYKKDARSTFAGLDNSMVSGLAGGNRVADIHEIPDALERAAERLARLGDGPRQAGDLPPAMRRTVALGRKIWTLLGKVRTGKHRPERVVDEIANLCLAGEDNREV